MKDPFMDWQHLWPYFTDRYQNLPIATQMIMVHALQKNIQAQIQKMNVITADDLQVLEEEFMDRFKRLLCMSEYHLSACKDIEACMYADMAEFNAWRYSWSGDK